MPLGEAREIGPETILVRCPLCGRTCVLGRTAGPVPVVHEPWAGAKGRLQSCRWVGIADPVGDDHRYVPIPDGEKPGDWSDRYRVKWEERYQVRAYLARHVNGNGG